MKRLAWPALVLLYLLHNDLWLWHDGRMAFGLPVGLLYHVGYCLVAAALLAWLVTGDRPGTEGERP